MLRRGRTWVGGRVRWEKLYAMLAVAIHFGNGADRCMWVASEGEFSFDALDGCLHALHLCGLFSDGLCVFEMEVIVHVEDAGDVIDGGVGVRVNVFFFFAKGIVAVGAVSILIVFSPVHKQFVTIQLILPNLTTQNVRCAWLRKNNSKQISQQMIGKAQGTKSITELLIPINVTSQEMAYSNRVYLSPQGKIPNGTRFIRMKGFILAAEFSKTVPKGKIGLNKKFRQFMSLSLIDQVLVQAYEPKPTDRPAASLHLMIELLLPSKQRVELDDVEMVAQLRNQFNGFYLAVEQIFVLNFAKTPVLLTVERTVGSQDGNLYLGPDTIIQASASGEQQIRLKSTKQQKKNVFSANFSMEALGIGGLDKELTNLFRRAFASRRLPHSILEKFGLKHIKGILLYGPPGTGKTLIARQLSIALKAKSIQIVNGPQVFDKYVGQSEQNIRKLFAPARQDQKRYGQESPLHVIVFDEIDAICRQRGSDGSGTGTKDGVVNQLLTNLDGVDALNNIIVIGMTNRKDLIDEAILRPGRLEVHLQITIPSEEGRLQILKIHTRQLQQQGLLDKQLDLPEIARLAKNYTGAELEAVVKNAVSFALQRGNDITKFSQQLVIKAGTKVTRQDFLVALEEVLPGFGLDQQKMEAYTRKQLHKYEGYFKIQNALKKTASLALAPNKPLTTLLMYGPKGSGKTSITCAFACQSEFTYVKIVAPQRYIGVDTYGRINSMTKIFNDAYKSTKSLIILDNIERLIEYVPTGPDYNNRLMQALMVLVKRIPTNPECHLLVIATSSNYRALELLDIDKYFAVKLKVPLLTPDEAAEVIQQKGVITESKPIKEIINFMEVSKNQRYSPIAVTPSIRV